jgi:hypothetical protein
MRKILILSSLLFLTTNVPNTFASCGAASCPLDNHRYLKGGWLQLGLAHEYINQDQIYVGSSKSFIGAIPSHHDEVQTLNERNILQLQSGITGRLGLNVDIPFVHREHSHIGHEDGKDMWESWNFSGLGDMVVSAQYALLVPSEEFQPYVSLVVGMKLPTGVTGFKNVDGEEAEVTIQPGTGSLDGIVGLNYRQTLLSVPTVSGSYSALPLTIGATYQFNGKGTYDYRFGNSLITSVGTAYQFTNRASLLFQANGRFQDFADVGTTGEFREDTGGTWIFASPGLSFQLADAFSAYGYVQLPIYQNVHGIQQTAKVNLLFGVSYKIDLLTL